MKKVCVVCILFVLSFSVTADKIKALIVDGVNNHNWQGTTEDTKAILLQTGKFTVDVSTSPSKKTSKEEWEKWQPEFSKYQVVISNFNDGGRTLWSIKTRKSFEEYIKNGGGFVVVHAANNSSTDWEAYNKIIAIGGWGRRKAGVHGYLLRKYEGQWKKDSPDKGASGGHGPQRDFQITIDKPEHPIVKGLPLKWMHAKDELYHSLRGPAENVEILGSAVSNKTKVAEPMILLVKYGKGTIFHTPMGQYNKVSTRCLGFQTVFARGTEFAATGKVTIEKTKNFPTEDKTATEDPTKTEWITADK